MKTLRIAAAAGLGLVALAATPALAAPLSGYVTANVNERSGPSTSYPPIVVIPAGSRITIYGCLSDRSWCDISWGPNRGWMYSAYLQVTYNARRVPLRTYSGIPFLSFNFGTYWDNHYRNRPFFNQRSKWRNFNWQNNHDDNDNHPNPPPHNNYPKPPMHTGNPPVFGNPGGHPPVFGKPNMNDDNRPHFRNGQKGYGKYKDCKWMDGKWVCPSG